MGRKKRDAYLTKLRPSTFDFLPDGSYLMECGTRAIPRKRTRDVQMLFVPRETLSLQLECDTLDNMIADHRTGVLKMDIEAAEV
jgi:hypothetical protein